MKTVELAQVSEINPKLQTEIAPVSQVSFVGMSDLDIASAKASDNEQRGYEDVRKGYTYFERGDILVAKITPCFENCKIGQAETKTQIAFGSTEFHVLRPLPGRIHDRFLLHFMRTKKVLQLGEMRMTGAGGQRRVPLRFLEKLKIPLPPIEEQRRIASILDAADNLRTKRRQALAKLDTLTQAIFIDMFGDPVLNGKKWKEERRLGEVADIRSGITKGRKVAGPTRSVPYMAVLNVQDGFLDLNTVKSIDATDKEIEKYRIRKGDLLLTEGGDPDKLGRGTVWNEEISEAIHQNHIFRARITNSDFSPIFLSRLISSTRGKRYFMRSAKQTTGIASINATQLRAFPLIEPPVDLQKQFELAVSRVSDFRSNVIVEQKIDNLFASLQQRAFRGDL